MTNAVRGEVTFPCGGVEHRLIFSTNALCALEEETGKSLTQIGGEVTDLSKVSIGLLRTLFWAGLRDHHGDVTLEGAGRIMDELTTPAATALVVKAFALAF